MAAGLSLTTMVIGAAPKAQLATAAAAAAEDPLPQGVVEAAPIVSVDSTAVADTAVPTSQAEGTSESAVPIVDPGTTAAPATTGLPLAVPGPTPTSRQPTTTQVAAPAAVAAPTPTPSSAAPTSTTGQTRTVAPTVDAAPTTAAPTTAAPTTAAPTTASATTVAPPTVTVAPTTIASPTYTVQSAGTVTLRFDRSSITVAGVATQPNWVYQIDVNGPRSVEVKFFNVSTHAEAEFHAEVESGKIKLG